MNIQKGMMNFGPAIGFSSLLINFEDSDFTNEKDLFERFESEMNNTFKQDYLKALTRLPLDEYFIFKGGTIEKKDNINKWDKFAQDLSKRSLEFQKKLLPVKNNPNLLKPPFMIFVGHPLEFTGMKNFYQNFNCVIILLDKNKKYSDLALVEMANHQFSAIMLRDYSIEDLKTEKLFEKININKFNIVDDSGSLDIMKYCFDNNVRYYDTSPRYYDNTVQTDFVVFKF